MIKHVPAWRHFAGLIFALRRLALALMLIAPALPASAVTPQQTYYDAAGRLIAVVDATNGSARYSYDATGNLLSITKLPYSALTVLQFSPVMGVATTTVIISGTGFGTTANTSVKFNGVAAPTPTAVTATQITVKVPASATTGPITVTSPAGTVTTTDSFTVGAVPVPTISGFSPPSGVSGDTLTVSGTNFDTINSKVYFNGQLAAIQSATATTLTVTVPVASSGHVSVETVAGTVTTASDFLIAPPGSTAGAIGASVRSSLGLSPSITLGTAGQIGLILFDGIPGQRASFSIVSSTFSSGALRLYGPTGAQIGADAALTAGTFVFPRDLTAIGTYTVAIVPAAGATGSATITLTSVPPVASAVMTLNSVFNATIGTAGQNAGASFVGTAGDRIAFAAQVTGGLSGQCFTLVLRNPDATTLYSKYACTAYLATGELVLPSDGNYTVSFVPGVAATGAVTFSLSKTVTTTIASTGGAPVLTIAYPGQYARATFSGIAGKHYSTAIVPGGGLATQCFTMQVLKPDASTLFSQQFCGGAGGTTGDLVLPVTGTYTLVYVPHPAVFATGTVQLSVAPAVTATIAATGGAPVLTIAYPGQIARATIALTAGAHFSTAVALGGGLASQCLFMQVFKPDGSMLFTQNGCGGAQTSGDVLVPVSGTYTLMYVPWANLVATGTAQLSAAPAVTTAIAAAGGAPVLTIAWPGQVARATFPATAGDHFSTAVALAGGLAGKCMFMQVIKPDGTLLLSQNGCSGGEVSGDLTAPATGTYTLLYYPWVNLVDTGTAQLSAAPAVTGSTTINAAGLAKGISYPGQVIRISFPGTAAQGIHVVLSTTGFGSQCFYYSTLNPDGSVLDTQRVCTTSFTSGALTLPATGTYTVLFSPSGFLTGTVTTSVTSP